MYIQMRGILALLLVIAMVPAVLAGCEKEQQEIAGTISDFDSQAHFQPGTSGDDPASGDTSREPLTGEFVVSDKKYDYKDANLVLLYVENQSNRHYNVTIKGRYLDENGATIEEETQTFEGFPSGWSNNFLFYPKVDFDSFTYELETEEYVPNRLTADSDGNPLASYIELTYQKNLYWQFGGNWVVDGADLDPDAPLLKMRDLCFDYELLNQHPSVKITASFHVIVLDTGGEIYVTDYEPNLLDFELINGTFADPIGGEKDGKGFVVLVQQQAGEDEAIPENVQGMFTAIFAVTEIFDYTEFLKQLS